MKVFGRLCRMLPFLALAAVFLLLAFYPSAESSSDETKIVEVWNVDTFEGGKGSRTAFLGRVAARLEEEDRNVRYFVQSYTAEGALAAMEGGLLPDVLSYGPGLGDITNFCIPLPYSFAGAEKEGKCYAVPWCRGKYVLFSMDNFEGEGKTAISLGGHNLPSVAAALSGIAGEEKNSSAAYTGFLSGEYRFLLGTQRDICRFRSRNVEVGMRELSPFCDLFQCVSVMKGEKGEQALRFVEALLSSETQDGLEEIGMFPPEIQKGTRTVGLFSSEEERSALADEAKRGSGEKFLDKFLKTV